MADNTLKPYKLVKLENASSIRPIKPSKLYGVTNVILQHENPYLLNTSPWYAISALLAKFLNFEGWKHGNASNPKFKKSKTKILNKRVVAKVHTLQTIAKLYNFDKLRCPHCSEQFDSTDFIKSVETGIYLHLMRPSILRFPGIGALLNSIGTARTNPSRLDKSFLTEEDGVPYFDNGDVKFRRFPDDGFTPSPKVRFVFSNSSASLMTSLKEYLFLRYSPASPLCSKDRAKQLIDQVKSIVDDFRKTPQDKKDEMMNQSLQRCINDIGVLYDAGLFTVENAQNVLNGDTEKFNKGIVNIVQSELENNVDGDVGYYNYTFREDKDFKIDHEDYSTEDLDAFLDSLDEDDNLEKLELENDDDDDEDNNTEED